MRWITGLACLWGSVWLSDSRAEELQPVPLSASSTQVRPMTGIVLWTTNEAVKTAPIQLEFSYLNYRRIVGKAGEYDWEPVEKLLTEVAGRRHQLVLRWYDTYVGEPSGVPDSIQQLPDYRGITALSEKKKTGFPDWSHPELQRFTLDFFTRFAAKYDRDPRLAFVQVGFGLWSEYHIYDGPMELGRTFPTRDYQARFARHLAETFQETPWMISVDAAGDHAPYAEDETLLALPFGVFDDSFNHARHKQENEPNWKALKRDRWQRSPAGGEFSFFQQVDQRQALDPKGPHGIPFEQQAAAFHVSFIIGDDQPRFQKASRILEAGRSCGYRFRVTKFLAGPDRAEVTMENTGIAPIYYDAFPAVNGIRSKTSLKGLLPGESRTFRIAAGGETPRLTIEADRLVPGQRIEYDADLK